MKWTISTRIAASLLAILMLFFSGMVSTFLVTTGMLRTYKTLFGRLTADLARIEDLRDSVHEQDIRIRTYVLSGQEPELAIIRTARSRMLADLAALKSTLPDEPLRQQLGTVRLMLEQYARTIDFIAIVRQERGADAAARYLEYGRFSHSMERELDELVQLSNDQVQRVTARNLRTASLLHGVFGVIFAISVLAAAFIAWRINALIMHPLHSLVAAARRVSRGDFDTGLSAAPGEFAEVGAAFNHMAAGLRQSFGELERGERKYRELTDLLPLIVYEADLRGYFTYTNKTGYEIMGYTPEDIRRGLHGTQVIAPDYLPKLQEGMQRIAAGETLLNREYVVRRKDGTTFPALFFTSPIVEDGAVTGASGIVVNIADIRQATESLERSEEKYRSIFEQSNDGIFLVDAQGMISEWNRRMSEITGLGKHAAIGRFAWDVEYALRHPAEKTPDSYERVKGRILEWIASGIHTWEDRLLELTIYLADGTARCIQNTIFPIKTRTGVLWGAITRDITEQRKNEQERARLAAAIEQADEAVVITDPAGIIQYINPAFTKMTGYERGEAIGRYINLLKSGRQDRQYYESLWRMVSRGDTWRGTLVNRKKDGALYDEAAVISPIRNAAGAVTNFVSVKRDITRELRTEAHLRQSQKIEAVGTLAGGIAHDFNNILGVILGYTELTVEQLRDRPELYGNLQQVLIAADRAKDLIRQILSISRQAEAAARAMPVTPVIKEIVKFMRASLPTTIEIRQKFQAPHDTVVADPIELHQVLMNLCTNAGYAMKDHGGMLEVSLQNMRIGPDEGERGHLRPGDYVLITVSDTGQGIAPEDMDRIFEPYFTTKEPGQGTGLGLAVAQGIVLARGGDIRAYSEPGKGSVFYVYLPLSRREKSSDTGVSADLPTGSERILFIDDEHELVKIASEILSHLGYAVSSHTDSRNALDTFKAAPQAFDLVITDKTMPGLTGFELAREIKQQRPDIPVILCTGFIEKNEPQEKLADIDEILPKPINRQNLAISVRRLLDRKQP